MFRSLIHLHGFKVSASDGDIGKVHDIYFEDHSWVVRYLVVDLGHWLSGRRVLIPPGMMGAPDMGRRSFPVTMTQERVRQSPDIDTDMPVSRQQEIELHKHFGWPPYWQVAGINPWPMFVPTPSETEERTEHKGDPHLRSAREVRGYHIHASDGSIGRVEDFLADDATWVIRYVVMDTRNWLRGKRVLLATQWLAEGVSYAQSEVAVAISRETIRKSPEYNPTVPVDRAYEERFFEYHGRPGYWEKAALATGQG